jgi:pimeloyl-ACP methyl ester carboxylesterase
LNRYTYVVNNPLKYIDPSGHKAWLIHGTRSSGKTWTPEFVTYVEDLFNESSGKLNWSGKNNNGARVDAAEAFFEQVYEWHKEHPNDPIRLVGHSHGGNVAIMLANLLAKKGMKVETLITVATPVRGYKLETKVRQHIHVYNNKDTVQTELGGSIWLLSYTFTRKFKNAENVRAKDAEQGNGIYTHSNMHSNINIWK